MSWASIANNQCISFNNLQDAVTTGVFILKAAIPVSLEQITKADANTHVYINTSYGPYASKASNQLVVKSNLQAITYFYLSYSTGGFSAACSAYPTTTIYYASYGSILQNGTIIYTDTGLTNPAPAGYYSDGNNAWQITSGGLAGAFYNQTSCSAPLLRTFRILNTDTVNSITLDVQINSVQVISPTLIPANTAVTLTPQVDCTGFTSELLEYQIVSGYTPSSASFSNGSGTYTGSIAGGFITFSGVDLTPNTNQDLTVNP
jgi:hypothetical protein